MAVERQYPTHEASLSSDASWDSLEGRLDGIESEALFDVAAAPGVAVGAIGTVTVSAVFGSAVQLTPHAERREVLAEASLSSDASWDSLESQLDGIESEALFLGRVDAVASGAVGTVTVSAIEGTATGATIQEGGSVPNTWTIGRPHEWPRIWQDEDIVILRRKTSSKAGV